MRQDPILSEASVTKILVTAILFLVIIWGGLYLSWDYLGTLP